jgi:hypothetical protein
MGRELWPEEQQTPADRWLNGPQLDDQRWAAGVADAEARWAGYSAVIDLQARRSAAARQAQRPGPLRRARAAWRRWLLRQLACRD